MSCRRGANCTLSTMFCSFLAGRLQLGLRRVQRGIGMLWGSSLQRRPWWSSETVLPVQGVWVPSLVRELRFHIKAWQKKKINKTNKMSKWLKTIKKTHTHTQKLSKSRNRLSLSLSGNHPGPDPVGRMIPEEQMEKKRTF